MLRNFMTGVIHSVFTGDNLASLDIDSLRSSNAGKVAIVTGGTAGLGRVTTLALARAGYDVIFTGRNAEHGAEVTRLAKEQNHDITFKQVDFADLGSVRAFAGEFTRERGKLDLLVNNAGMLGLVHVLTRDGFEGDLQANALAPFYLTRLLLPLLRASPDARIVDVTSDAHWDAKLDLEDLNSLKWRHLHQAEDQKADLATPVQLSTSSSLAIYSNSKFLNILLSKKLHRELQAENCETLQVYLLHPGMISTSLGRDSKIPGAKFFMDLLMAKPETGARTQIYLSLAPKDKLTPGVYYVSCQPGHCTASCDDVLLQDQVRAKVEEMLAPFPATVTVQ